MIFIEFAESDRPLIRIERDEQTNAGAWAALQEAVARGVVGGDRNRIHVRADVFLAELDSLRKACRLFNERVEWGELLRAQIVSLTQDRKTRELALAGGRGTPANLQEALENARFKRILKSFQLRNLRRLQELPHGADFSVPGAGKTTVALANFALNVNAGLVRKALVIGPLSSFSAWKDDVAQCFYKPLKIIVHTSVQTAIPDDVDILLTNYNRVAADYDRIRRFVGGQATQVILDEAHRVKRGSLGVYGRAVLDLAYAAKRRDVLTGTPAPQGAYDLVALIRFLYPGQERQILPAIAFNESAGREADVLAATSKAVSQYFVRTTKTELLLPKTTFNVERRPMGDIQGAIYTALLGRYRAAFKLSPADKREFNRIGRVSMYLLEAATNPSLLLAGSDVDDDGEFLHPPLEIAGDERLADLLANYGKYETPWKYARVVEIVKAAAVRKEKVLIWSNFVRNLKSLHRLLTEFSPAMVHGGIPSAEEGDMPGRLTREQEFSRFKNDERCSVLLANPAACGEGVSLHHWCHHAIYLDRTFNAGQFLQSQDRIHRLGLADNVETTFTILVSEGTIDDSVAGRLRIKVTALSELMGDPGLVDLALPDPEDGEGEPIVNSLDDSDAALSHILEV